jgi:hypothetical protein
VLGGFEIVGFKAKKERKEKNLAMLKKSTLR